MQQSNSNIGITLVTGATGSQGAAVVDNLLQRGHKVRAVTRDPQKSSVLTPFLKQYPGQLEIVKASYEDSAALESALKGVTGVFSVQVNNFASEVAESDQAKTLISLAKKAGVKTFVQTTVGRAGEHESFPRWKEGYWSREYWVLKAEVEKAVKEAGFEYYTILKPSGFMDNFIAPKVHGYFPDLVQKGELNFAIPADTKLHQVATNDIGKFATAAFEDPKKFNKKLISLSGEPLTLQEIGKVLSQALGTPVKVNALTPEEAIKQGQYPAVVRFWEWIRDVGYKVDSSVLKEFGIPLISFEDWVKENVKKV